jgi:hypothetical protein
MGALWIRIQKSLKPWKPLIWIVALLGPLQERAHITTIQETG